MKNLKTKNILICVSGLTPQIIAESLYCLAVKKKIPIDELYIATTAKGKNVLFGKDKGSSPNKRRLKDVIAEMAKKYKIKPPLFKETDEHIIVAKEESIELFDIRTDKHNRLFPNRLCEFIRNKTEDVNSTLYCSISGGRKTMSVHMAFAMSLFGRGDDKLLHVLTSEENEFKDYFPKSAKEARQLEMAEIPYVKLRPLLNPELEKEDIFSLKYSELVGLAQKRLKITSDKQCVYINKTNRTVLFNNKSIQLEAALFAIYAYFAEMKISGKEYLNINNIENFHEDLMEYVRENMPGYYIQNGSLIKKGFSKEDFRVRRSKINNRLSEIIKDKDILEEFRISSDRQYGDSKYHINASKDKIKISI